MIYFKPISDKIRFIFLNFSDFKVMDGFIIKPRMHQETISLLHSKDNGTLVLDGDSGDGEVDGLKN